MPSLNQNFTRLTHDSYLLQFTPTDGNITGNAYAAWWGLSDTNTAVTNSSMIMKGWTHNGTGPQIPLDAYNNSTYCQGNPSQLLAINGTGADLNCTISGNSVKILIVQSLMELITTNGDYYHELVLMNCENVGTTLTAFQCSSHVAASGLLTVKDSIFTNRTYR